MVISNLKFIDFHTHSDRQDPDLINLQTLHVTPNLQSEALPKICSLGLHPWFVEIESWESAWSNLVNLAKSSQVIAIGECGLDRNISLPMELQTSIFQKHIELTERLQKPLVIHCVRAFDEIIALKKNNQSSTPWIIHGFNKKIPVFQQLLQHNFYFSFGASILSDRSPTTQAIAIAPNGRFLLETDDRSDITIEQIYHRAAALRRTSVETLQTELAETYHQLTGRLLSGRR